MSEEEWVEIGKDYRFKVRTWTYGERREILKRITKRSVDRVTGQTLIELDPLELQDEMMMKCVAGYNHGDWNRKTLDELPAPISDELITIIQKKNSLSEDDRKKS